MRRTRAASCSGLTATTICVVEQLGLAMIPWCLRMSSALTSGITNGTVGFIRQWPLSSTTIAPRRTAWGTKSRAISSGVLAIARFTPSKDSGLSSSTRYFSPAKRISLPAERAEARNLIRWKGNLRSSSSWRMIVPTAPVAPTTATDSYTYRLLNKQRLG